MKTDHPVSFWEGSLKNDNYVTLIRHIGYTVLFSCMHVIKAQIRWCIVQERALGGLKIPCKVTFDKKSLTGAISEFEMLSMNCSQTTFSSLSTS
jgi:hypothetical protein